MRKRYCAFSAGLVLTAGILYGALQYVHTLEDFVGAVVCCVFLVLLSVQLFRYL